MNSAEHVITKIGGGSMATGVKLVAMWLQRSRQRVYSMTWPRERGGTGGFVPAPDQPLILAMARRHGIDLKPDDFFGITDLPPLGTPANCNDPTVTAGTLPRDEKAGENLP